MATRERWIFSSVKKDVDAIVLMNAVEPNLDGSFFYATGIPNGLFEGCLAIVRPSGVEVLTSELEALSAEEAGVRTKVFENGEERTKLMRQRLSRYRKIGINSKELTLANFKTIKKAVGKAKLVDVSDDLYKARMIKQIYNIRLIDLYRVRFAFGNAGYQFARYTPYFALKIAHSRLARIVTNNCQQRVIRKRQFYRAQTILADLARYQILLSNLDFFLLGIAADLNDFHAVEQGCRDRIKRIGRGNEHDL